MHALQIKGLTLLLASWSLGLTCNALLTRSAKHEAPELRTPRKQKLTYAQGRTPQTLNNACTLDPKPGDPCPFFAAIGRTPQRCDFVSRAGG